MTDLLKVPLPDKHIRLAWKGVNEAVIYSDSNTPDVESASNLLTHVKWLSCVQEPIMRYLAIQSYHIFESTQNLSGITKEGILTKSREYQAIMFECDDQLTVEIGNIENANVFDEEKFDFMTTQCNIVRDNIMIWQLAEIFFIKLSSAGYFMCDLQSWLGLQQPHIELQYASLIDQYNSQPALDEAVESSSTLVEQSDLYWSTAIGLCLHNRRNELLNLLSMHSHANSLAFRAVRRALQSQPILGITETDPAVVVRFSGDWAQWRHYTEAELLGRAGSDSRLLAGYPDLELIGRLLVGQRDAFLDRRVILVSDRCWYFALVAFLSRSEPMADATRVSQLSPAFRREFSRLSNTDAEVIDDPQVLRVVDAVFDIDLGAFVSLVSRNNPDWWLCAHLVDLIHKIDPHSFPAPLVPDQSPRSIVFDESMINNEWWGGLREMFILEYASRLVSHPSLSIIGLNYMHYCGATGAAWISAVIDRMPMKTDRQATAIHSWCVKRNLNTIAASICKRRSIAAFKEPDQLGNSLMWAIRGGDTSFISRIADRMLRDKLSGDQPSAMTDSLTDCLRDSLNLGLVGKKMTFVVEFARIEQLESLGQYEQAIRNFINLLEAQLVSSHFLLDILLKMRRLWERPGLLKTGDIEKLLEIVEEIDNGKDNRSPQIINELRHLLVKELSVACLIE